MVKQGNEKTYNQPKAFVVTLDQSPLLAGSGGSGGGGGGGGDAKSYTGSFDDTDSNPFSDSNNG